MKRDALSQEIQLAQWIVEGLIPDSTKCLVLGRARSGKSLFPEELALAVCSWGQERGQAHSHPSTDI